MVTDTQVDRAFIEIHSKIAKEGKIFPINSLGKMQKFIKVFVGRTTIVEEVIRAPTPPPVIKTVYERAPTPEPEVIERVGILKYSELLKCLN